MHPSNHYTAQPGSIQGIPILFSRMVIWFIFMVVQSHTADLIDDFKDFKGTRSGRTLFHFLTIPVSASQLGKNPIASSLSSDATDVAHSPAGTAFLKEYKFSLTHLEWLMGLRKEYSGLCMTQLDKGTVGFYTQGFTLGNYANARTIDERPSRPDFFELSAGGSYARQLIYNRLSAGLAISYVGSWMDGSRADGVNATADIAARWETGTAHLYLRNAGPPVRYTEDEEAQPLQAGISLCAMPFARFDSTHFMQMVNPVFAVGAQKLRDGPLITGYGFEMNVVRSLKFRVGYEHGYSQPYTIQGLSAGMGLHLRKMGFDIGWKEQSSVFGPVWALTIDYTTEEMIPRTALDYYNVAVRFFEKQHYDATIEYALKALKLNPSLWQAHALINDARSRMRQSEGLEIVMLYTGNNQGRFLPEEVNGMSVGGLAYQAAVINQQTSLYPTIFAIDAGNCLAPTSTADKAGVMDLYFQNTHYSGAAIGPAEVDYPIDKYSRVIKNFSEIFVNTNVPRTKHGDHIYFRTFTAGKYAIALVNVVASAFTNGLEFDSTIAVRVDELKQIIQSTAITRCNFKILVAHDSWRNIQTYASELGTINAIICGSLTPHFEAPIKKGSALLLSNGSAGKYVGKLTIRFDVAKKIESLTNKLILITDEIIPNYIVEQAVKNISVATFVDSVDEKLHQGSIQRYSDLVPFITTKHGRPQLYLKTLSRHHEIPHSDTATAIFAPQISTNNGIILYFKEDYNSRIPRLIVHNITSGALLFPDFKGRPLETCFSTDGSWIYAVVRQNDTAQTTAILRMKSDGGPIQTVIPEQMGSQDNISISPDGSTLLFTCRKQGTSCMYVSDVDGSSVTAVTEEPVDHDKPRFSPASDQIAYLSESDNFKGNYDLWLYTVATGAKKRLTTEGHVKNLCWIDGRTVAYVAGYNITDLNLIDVESGKSNKIITATGMKDYSESDPVVITQKRKAKILYVRRYLDGKKRIFVVNPDGSDDRRFTLGEVDSWLR